MSRQPGDANVIDKWFASQARADVDDLLPRVARTALGRVGFRAVDFVCRGAGANSPQISQSRALEVFWRCPMCFDPMPKTRASGLGAAREGWSTGPGCVEVRQLMEHPEFTLKNPNRLRSVVSVFIGSPQFHLADGSGYDFALEMIPKAGRAVGALRVSSCPRKVARVKRRALCSGGRPEPPGGGGHGQRRLPDLAKVGPRPAGADPREAEGPAEDEPRTREKIQAWYLWAGFKGKPKCNIFFSLGGGAP